MKTTILTACLVILIAGCTSSNVNNTTTQNETQAINNSIITLSNTLINDYDDPNYNFSIGYPNDYAASIMNGDVIISSDERDLYYILSIVLSNNTGGYLTSLENAKEYYLTQFTQYNPTLTSSENKILSNQTAIDFVIRYTVEDVNYANRFIIGYDNQYFYVLQFVDTIIDYSTDATLINNIISSYNFGNTAVISETSEPVINETIEETPTFSDKTCTSLTDATMQVTTLSEDTTTNPKSISVCSVNHDVMNSVNMKYYTFTISEPTRIYALLDGYDIGAWQLGIIGQDWTDGTSNEPVYYTADLEAGTYTIYARLTNALGSTCTGSDCYFELPGNSRQYWISGTQTAKLGYRLTLSTSLISASDTLEDNTVPEVSHACTSLNAKTVGIDVSHSTETTPYAASICDRISGTFTSPVYDYYSFTLPTESTVRLTLTKPEGRWTLGVNDYGWNESTTMSSESVIYEYKLPAGEHLAYVQVSNVAGLSGSDWGCRQIVTDGTCWWTNGAPPNGTYYLTYTLTLDLK